jgi:chemotaxis signal transduction protein
MHADEPYLDLTVGPYALAISAGAVLLVRQDVRLASSLDVRGVHVPACDLGALFGLGKRPVVPFLIACDGGGRVAALGVDRVGHLRQRDVPTLRHVPALGLRVPQLFAGGIAYDERLLLVLDPVALVELTHDRGRPI